MTYNIYVLSSWIYLRTIYRMKICFYFLSALFHLRIYHVVVVIISLIDRIIKRNITKLLCDMLKNVTLHRPLKFYLVS